MCFGFEMKIFIFECFQVRSDIEVNSFAFQIVWYLSLTHHWSQTVDVTQIVHQPTPALMPCARIHVCSVPLAHHPRIVK